MRHIHAKMSTRLINPALTMALATLLAMATGCKTTEANYRAAYEKTVAKQNEGYDPSELKEIKREEAMPKTIYQGDSIPLKGMYVRAVEETGKPAATALKYNVVTGMFSQRFNAASALKRIRENGYPDAILLTTGDKKFIVDAYTTQSLDSAVTVYRQISEKPPYPLSSPFPYILKKP